MQKPVQVRQVSETNPANWIILDTDQLGWWGFTPAQINETWAIRTVDGVRGIDSGWHTIELNKRQMKMTFTWTPVAVTEEPPPSDPLDAIRDAAWGKLGVPYNPDAAFPKYARVHNLGVPMAGEFDVAGYRAQGYAGGIVYCKIGDWGNVQVLPW
jgi:hypothetical protein